MTRPGIELRSPGPLANTLPTKQITAPMKIIYICVCTHTHMKLEIYLYNTIIHICTYMYYSIIEIYFWLHGAHGEMVIVVGNGHGDTSSNPGRDWLHFT